MEYKYELLRKCHGLRFRATLSDKREEGIIKVGEDSITLCYGAKDHPGRMFIFERTKTLSFTEQSFGVLPNDFEIVPRDPETYQDWQVGDEICGCGKNKEIIFRSGEVVVFKYHNGHASDNFTCRELFETGYRLVRTNVEEQIIEERKRQEWTPQDGDILTDGRYVVIYSGTEEKNIITYAACDSETSCLLTLKKGTGWGCTYEYHSANDKEKQALFDALADNGKRWNAEKKVMEDIPKPHEFKEGEPVLVKDYDDNIWKLAAFRQRSGNASYPYEVRDERGNCCNHRKCIPYNEKTMHLLGTTEDYKEE